MIKYNLGQENVMHLAIDTFGITAQADIAIEECAELIQAVSKFKRYGFKKQKVMDNLVEEMADVLIMIRQLQIMTGIETSALQEQADFKIQRFYDEHLRQRPQAVKGEA